MYPKALGWVPLSGIILLKIIRLLIQEWNSRLSCGNLLLALPISILGTEYQDTGSNNVFFVYDTLSEKWLEILAKSDTFQEY